MKLGRVLPILVIGALFVGTVNAQENSTNQDQSVVKKSQKRSKKSAKNSDVVKSSKASAYRGQSSNEDSDYSDSKSFFSGVVIRPMFGYEFTNFGESGTSIPGNAISFGLALDYPVLKSGNHNLSAGIRLEHLGASSDSVAFGQGGLGEESTVVGKVYNSVSAWPLMLTASYLYSVNESWSFGGNLGLGLALGYSLDHHELDQTSNIGGATPFTGLLGGEAKYSVSHTVGFQGEVGYRLLSSNGFNMGGLFSTLSVAITL